MRARTVPSGLPAVGDVHPGTHFCQFYETRADLEETLVPFFRAGLENNERCLWVTCEPLDAQLARDALAAALPDVDARIEAGQLEILDQREWYGTPGRLRLDDALSRWLRCKDEALARGYSGLRLTGDTAWLTRRDWKAFAEYEARIDGGIAGQPIIALCSYCLRNRRPADLFDVMRAHHFALAREDHGWELVESASVKRAREELRRLNEELEERVASRTAALEEALAAKEALLRELNHRIKNNLQVITSLINLKASTVQHEAVLDAFATTSARLRSMSLVHEMLYGEGGLTIDFGDYLRRLGHSLVASFGAEQRIAIDFQTTRTALDVDTSITLGLIVNEIISNALKHAFPQQRAGRIGVQMVDRDGGFILTVSDDGVGLSDDAAAAGADHGVGLALIRALAKKLDAEPRLESSHGTTWTIPLTLSS